MVRLPCVSCGSIDEDKFRKISNKYISLSKKCINCHREDERERGRAYYHKNRSVCLSKNKKWREENRERYNKLMNDYYHRNKHNNKYIEEL